MSRLEDKFDKSISEYNENVSDFHKFSLSPKEKAMFLNMMKEYGRECSQASLEKAYQESLIDGNSQSRCGCEINKESITNPENIVLL